RAPLGLLVRRPDDIAYFGHGRETVFHRGGIALRLEGIAPRPVDAQAALAGCVFAGDMVLVISTCGGGWRAHGVVPRISAQGCEPAQRLEPRQKEVSTAAQGRKGREASNLPANGALRDLEFERSVVSPPKGVALITELVEVTIVHPDVLRELELPDE